MPAEVIALRGRRLDDYEQGALDAMVAWEARKAGRVRRWRRTLACVLRALAEWVTPSS